VPNLLGLAYLSTWMTKMEEQKQLVQCLFGTQAYDGDFHQNGYTEFLLRNELREAGFGTADFTPLHEWLFDVVAIKCAPEGELRLEDCIFMTLEKPSDVVVRRSEPSSAPDPSLASDSGTEGLASHDVSVPRGRLVRERAERLARRALRHARSIVAHRPRIR
jgi:hypothetical protein